MFKSITPEMAGIPSSEVARYVDHLNDCSLCTHSLLLIRDDAIFTEAYWKPFTADTLHRQYSQTKSLVSIAIGLLVSDGLLSLDDRIVDLFPERIDGPVSDRLARQTVRHMLTMSTAGEPKWWFAESDPDRTHIYFNDRITDKHPGALWQYDSAGSQVLASLVEKLAGMLLLDFLRMRVFSHMGSFENAVILKTPNGESWGDSALLSTARDMASFGKLMMDGGRWGDKQLVDESYVRTATSRVVDNSEEKLGHVFGHGYGYQFWRAPRGGFACVGMGGQLTVVIPDKRLILVINSDNQGNEPQYDTIVNGFISFIVDRISDTQLPENNADQAALAEKISSLELFALKGREHSPLAERIDGRTYICEDNPLGITRFTFSFSGDVGELRYTNSQGDKVIPFGINKNVFGFFPQLGYSDGFGREVTTNGHTYRDAVSLRFTDDNKLQLKVQIIDKYLGNLLATFAFTDTEAEALFISTAENFLNEYRGRLFARAL